MRLVVRIGGRTGAAGVGGVDAEAAVESGFVSRVARCRAAMPTRWKPSRQKNLTSSPRSVAEAR